MTAAHLLQQFLISSSRFYAISLPLTKLAMIVALWGCGVPLHVFWRSVDVTLYILARCSDMGDNATDLYYLISTIHLDQTLVYSI